MLEMSVHCCHKNAGFEVLITVVLKSSVFFDITLCSPSSDISEEYIASVLKVEEQDKQNIPT
jgi:hypothetical protein